MVLNAQVFGFVVCKLLAYLYQSKDELAYLFHRVFVVESNCFYLSNIFILLLVQVDML